MDQRTIEEALLKSGFPVDDFREWLRVQKAKAYAEGYNELFYGLPDMGLEDEACYNPYEVDSERWWASKHPTEIRYRTREER